MVQPYIGIVHSMTVRVFAIRCPAQRVVDEVFPNAIQGVFIADDVFVVIALPDWGDGEVVCFMELFGDGRFEPAVGDM